MYHAKVLEKVETETYWKNIRIDVFDGENQIGSYLRNYGSFGTDTFCPFIGADDKWYAIYSEDYTATSIMSLPDCKRIGGENRDQWGFCPTGLHVPRYTEYVVKAVPSEKLHEYPKENWERISKDRIKRSYEEGKNWEETVEPRETDSLNFLGNIKYDLRLGLVMGCIWGDDTSYKLQRLDLTQAHEGILKREESFGYLELPGKLCLMDCITIDGNESRLNVSVACMKHFSMRDGVIKESV
jgi:hypothetical protein